MNKESGMSAKTHWRVVGELGNDAEQCRDLFEQLKKNRWGPIKVGVPSI